MRTKTVLFVVALFLMQGYAMNMNVQDDVLNIEADESATSGRSINVMPAISDAMQQYMLDNQDQNGDNDNDGDGIADDVDKDDDNDCIPDIWDADREDFDSDGINDADDLDDDGDGFNDSEEVTDTDNLTNIYDSDNDGYHDCSSMGMLQMNMLDVLVNVLADGSVTFSIDALELVTGENAEVFWNLVDTDDFLQLNNSTTSFVVSTTGSWGDSGTWYGLADGPYCLNVELSGSDASGNSVVLDSAQECFTIDSSSNGGGNNGNSTTDCEGGSDPYPTGSEWIEVNPHPAYGQNIASGDELRAIVSIGNLSNAGDCNATYEIRTLIDRTVATGGGAAGGSMFLAYPSDLQMTMQSPPPGYTAVCVGSTTCSFEISAFPSDACYSIYIGIYVYPSNTNTALGQRLDHANDYNDLWVVGGVDCTTGEYEEEEEEETNLTGECSFPTFGATPTELYSGDDLTFTWTMDGDVSDQVYLALMSGWGAQYYFSSIEDNDGSHTITLPANMNPNADYTIYIESAYDDNRTTLCWKYGSIDILEEDEDIVIDDIIDMFLNTTDERPRISMWYGKVNQHNEDGTWMTDPDGVAGAGLYSQWGSEGWGDRKLEYCQRFWPDTVEIRTSAPEEIVFYTRGNTDAYLTMKPVWLCVQDTDGDGILDPEDQDDDGDGWADIIEEVCLSDALDANVVPADLDGDGLCDVLQNLLIEDSEPAEPGFCTNGEITGGSGLLGQTEFIEVVLIERTGGNNQYQFEIQDTSGELYADIVQQPWNFDFVGYYEYYDVFVSDANGEFDMNGSFITIQARSDLGTSNLGVGHNIDSIGLRDANGNVIYATEVVAVELGDGLGTDNPAGRQDQILGPADQASTFLGNNEASITVSFCSIDTASEDETVPGFGVMSAFVALGAAMLAGRRTLNGNDE